MSHGFLDQCERERLHLSRHIQAFGGLLIWGADGRLSHRSDNLGKWVDMSTENYRHGSVVPDWLQAAAHELGTEVGNRRTQFGVSVSHGGLVDLRLIRARSGQIICELWPSQGAFPFDWTGPGPSSDFNSPTARQALVDGVRQATSFQRVMYYQFHDDGHGEVVAESRNADVLGSYLGLHFPASDIPKVARELYLQNPWRLIADARATAIPVLGETAEPPDLTWADLRSVSPVHCAYLQNMGVRSSLSFPVVIAGQLVAMITAHHELPQVPALSKLASVSEHVHDFALRLATQQSQRRMRLLDGLGRRFEHIDSVVQRHGGLLPAWAEIGPWLMHEFAADGATISVGDTAVSTGLALEPAARAALDRWLLDSPRELVMITDSLAKTVIDWPLSAVAGVLALRVLQGESPGLRVYLTREEVLQHVTWGGNPDKPVESVHGANGIAPRRSFEAWVETRLGRSLPWNNEAKLLGLRLRDLLKRQLAD